MDSTNTNTEQIKLDLSLLNDGELSLLKSQTGIEDMEALTKHVEDVTSRAHKVSCSPVLLLVQMVLTGEFCRSLGISI